MDLKATDRFGRTVLHEAADNGSFEMVKYLIEQEVDPKAKNETNWE